MSASREHILRAVRERVSSPAPMPTTIPEGLRFDDLAGAFAESLAAAGGACIRVGAKSQLEDALAAFEPSRERHYCRVGLGLPPPGDVSRAALANLDVAVLAGRVAVAESGAVWVVPENRDERAAAFLAERLVLVVPESGLVHDLHAAYARIDPAAHPFGCFIAGPSKTADIEQALVIGAHGPRALHVLLFAEA